MNVAKRILVPAVVCSIGLIGAVANAWLIRSATRGHGVASDPGYYERALAWDDHMQATAAAARLGVIVETTMTRDRAIARLCVTLHDAAGRPLSPDRVSAAASANLCPRARLEAVLEADGRQFCAAIPDACPGVWIVDTRATVDGSTVAGRQRVELAVGP